MDRIAMKEYILSRLEQTKSEYKGTEGDRARLYEFFSINDWFGLAETVIQKDFIKGDMQLELSAEEIEEIDSRVILWLSAYKKTHEEKYILLVSYGLKIYPETVAAYDTFIKSRKYQHTAKGWKLLDFLLSELEMEILKYDSAQMEILADKASQILPWQQAHLLAAFWQSVPKTDRNQMIFHFQPSMKEKHTTEAYPLEVFAKMAYLIFNEKSWIQNDMVRKACESGVYANLWAFVAFHFVCGLRSVDILLIEKPRLAESGEHFRQKVLHGEILSFREYAEEIQILEEISSRQPNKTKRYTHIPDVKIFIPESLKDAMGMIIAIAASYRKDNEVLLKPDRRFAHIRAFFGKQFGELLYNKDFESKRANKAYLQGIEMVTKEQEGDSIKGYMLAALARSHKGGIGELAEVTDVYLQDARFSGVSADIVAREMFERGVFGFIPYLILCACFQKYEQLTIPQQTIIIKELDIKPTVLEEIVRIRDRSFYKAKTVLDQFIKDGIAPLRMAKAIATGNAVSKDKHNYCLISAADHICVYPTRKNCTGCSYEIYSKSGLLQLMKEYSRLQKKINDIDGWKYQAIIRELILPAVTEYIATVEQVEQSDMNFIDDIMEGALTGYDNQKRISN